MFDATKLLGALMDGGMTRSSSNRMQSAMGGGSAGFGQVGDMLSGLMGGGRSAGGAGGLADMAQGLLGQARGAAGRHPQAVSAGGLGALAGALFGGGGDSIKGALGGAALAVLGSVAMNALRKNPAAEPADSMPAGLEAVRSQTPPPRMQEEALLMLRAMISAAKADGQVDQQEISRIAAKVHEAGAEAESFLRAELQRPMDMQSLVSGVRDLQTAAEVYAASLLAIEVDTQAERDYLQRLAAGLGLNDQVVQRIHAALGV